MSDHVKDLVLNYISERLHANPADMSAEPVETSFFQRVTFWRAGDFDSFPPNIHVLMCHGKQVSEVKDDGFGAICKAEPARIDDTDGLIKYLKFYFWAADSGDVLSTAEDIGGISDEHLGKWKSQVHPVEARWSHLGGHAELWLWNEGTLYHAVCTIDPNGHIQAAKTEMEHDIGVVITLE